MIPSLPISSGSHRGLRRGIAFTLTGGLLTLTSAIAIPTASATTASQRAAQARSETVAGSDMISYFPKGSSALTSAAKKNLRAQVSRITNSQVPGTAQAVVVTGRADRTCGTRRRGTVARGDFVCNWRTLARARATQVARYLRTLDFTGNITKRTHGIAGTKAARSAKSVFTYTARTVSITIVNSTGDNTEFTTAVAASWTCPTGTCTGLLSAPTPPDYLQTELAAVVSAPLTSGEVNVMLTIPTVPIGAVNSTYFVQTSGATTCTPEHSSSSETIAVFRCAVAADGEILQVSPTVV